LQGIPQEEELVGGTLARSRFILAIYCLLTLAVLAALAMTGSSVFTALLHTLASVSTGGFSPFNQSLAGLESSLGVAAVVGGCVAGAIPTLSYYQAWQRGIIGLLEDRQLWCLLGLGLVVGAVLFPWMPSGETTSILQQAGHAVATAFSAQTTAGFATVDVSGLAPAAKAALIFSMAIGGGAGSTAGGLKLLRLMILWRFIQLTLFYSSLPRHAVASPRLAGRRLNAKELQEASIYLTLGLLVVSLSWFAFVAMEYDPLDSLFEVVSAMGTVGLSAGITGQELPPLLKGVLCIDMLMGRLEIIAILILLYPRTWIGTRRNDS
jgi:trk system potassium uptake protein TrkH